MSTNFTSRLRVLVCDHCGAPLELPIDGGSVRCTFCNATMVRDARVVAGPAGAAVSEGERFARLWQQTNIPPPVSAVLASFAGTSIVSAIAPERLDEAIATWRTLLAKAKSVRGENEDLIALTMALAVQPAFDNRRIRAMAETVLEALSLPRERHAMLAMLSNAACRESDAEGAVGWLAQMDPRSDELRVDSPFRVSHAAYETLRGSFARVLPLLGSRHEDVPMHSQWTLLATILRANAIAKLGDPVTARAQLVRLPNPELVGTIADRWPVLALFRG